MKRILLCTVASLAAVQCAQALQAHRDKPKCEFGSPTAAPSVLHAAPAEPSAHAARLTAAVCVQKGVKANVWFTMGSSAVPLATQTVTGDGEKPVEVSTKLLTNLREGTHYFFRAVVETPHGKAESRLVEFVAQDPRPADREAFEDTNPAYGIARETSLRASSPAHK